MPTRRWLLTIAVLVFACRCAPVAAPTPAAPAIARTAYVRDGAALIASPDARAALVDRLAHRQLRGVAPYQLSPLLVDAGGRTRLAAWIDEVHRAGGQVIVPVAGIDRVGALARVVAEHPGTWIDGAVTEVEYWNQTDRADELTGDVRSPVARLARLRQLLAASARTLAGELVELDAELADLAAQEAQLAGLDGDAARGLRARLTLTRLELEARRAGLEVLERQHRTLSEGAP